MGIRDITRGLLGRGGAPAPDEPSPDERPDPEGCFYALAELDQAAQSDRDVQQAYGAEIIGFTLYRDYEVHNQSELAFAPEFERHGGQRLVKAVFDDYESTFVKQGPDGWQPIAKSDLPLPLVKLAVADGYASPRDLAAAEARVVAERAQRVADARALLLQEGFEVRPTAPDAGVEHLPLLSGLDETPRPGPDGPPPAPRPGLE